MIQSAHALSSSSSTCIPKHQAFRFPFLSRIPSTAVIPNRIPRASICDWLLQWHTVRSQLNKIPAIKKGSKVPGRAQIGGVCGIGLFAGLQEGLAHEVAVEELEGAGGQLSKDQHQLGIVGVLILVVVPAKERGERGSGRDGRCG